MELREALTQISEIRLQLARSQVFRGYRAAPLAFSGALAVAAAGCQALWIPEAAGRFPAYATLWIGVAVLSVTIAAAATAIRCRSSPALARELTWLAVTQFLPCVVAGGLLTVVLPTYAPASLWMLPGLWQMLFSLGIFASYRLLPKATLAVAVFYLAAGMFCLSLGPAAFSPWAMGIPFGVGQLLAAAVLYWNLERNHVEP